MNKHQTAVNRPALEYTGTCYIGVVGPDTIPTQAILTIMNIKREEGDAPPRFVMGTKGYETRQKHINAFMESDHDFILLLDHDMIFEPDTLSRLRSHKRPYVSGLYMRRRFAPMASVWYEPFSGEWPMMPFLEDPERGRLHEIGASGWGCVLIHREVIENTRPLLGGEWDVLEDDMNAWPTTGKPLRPSFNPVGSDIRFPFFALHAGYQMYGDPDVRPAHLLSYPLSPNDYSNSDPKIRQMWAEQIRAEVAEERKRLTAVGGA